MGIRHMNQWLAKNPQRILVSRSPIPFVGGAFVGTVKSLHDRGGQVILSDTTVLRRLEGDWDGDAIQLEFLPDNVMDTIDNYIKAAGKEGRLKPITLNAIADKEGNDLSKIENVYNLTSQFIQGQTAIGEIANVQAVYGQLGLTFRHAQFEGGFIILKDLTKTKVNFPEAGLKGINMERELRMWLQAATDNGKFLLLKKWDYSQEKLLRKMFAVVDADGKYMGEVTDDMWEALKPMVNMHKRPGRIKNGRTADGAYTISSLLAESKIYKQYLSNRNAFLQDMASDKNMQLEFSFNDKVAPLEEIAALFANMWEGDVRTDQTARIEPGKITPVEFTDGVYTSVHMATMDRMETVKEQSLTDALIDEGEMRGEPLTQAEGISRISIGEEFAQEMWTAVGDKDGVGRGFTALLEEFGETIGPQSWDHNPELTSFTAYWSPIFNDLTKVEQIAATYEFLEGFYQYNKETEANERTKNRRVLPPISVESIFTTLDAQTMAMYFAHYNTLLNSKEQRMENAPAFSNNLQSLDIVKKVCK